MRPRDRPSDVDCKAVGGGGYDVFLPGPHIDASAFPICLNPCK
jgi:hypothetical protein